MSFEGRVAIVGIGQTRFGSALGLSERELAVLAIDAALADAGIKPAEIDALCCYTMEMTRDFDIVRDLGLGPLTFFSQISHGGGAGPGAIGQAALAIAAGIARAAIVWRSRKRSSPASRVWAQSAATLEDHWKWSRPSGLLRPVDEVAMLTRRYFHEFGDATEALAEIAVRSRDYARANPQAMMFGKPLTRDQYIGSRMVSEPLRLYDNCLESDGAVALIVTSVERARALRTPVVIVEAFSQGLMPDHLPMADFYRESPLVTCSSIAARKLWSQTEIEPKDIDVAQFYDAFSPLVLFALENYGFCERGEASEFIRSQGIGLNGALPVNTAGGSLSEAYIHGMNLITEAVRQLRGDAVCQVPNATNALVTGCDATPTSAMILRRAA